MGAGGEEGAFWFEDRPHKMPGAEGVQRARGRTGLSSHTPHPGVLPAYGGGPSAKPVQGPLPARVPECDSVPLPSPARCLPFSTRLSEDLFSQIQYNQPVTFLPATLRPQLHIPEMTQTQIRPTGRNTKQTACLQCARREQRDWTVATEEESLFVHLCYSHSTVQFG